jgi:hypothetical protein
VSQKLTEHMNMLCLYPSCPSILFALGLDESLENREYSEGDRAFQSPGFSSVDSATEPHSAGFSPDHVLTKVSV